jgi:ribosomal protein S18 acetylase RimI-like enzyme
MVRKVASDWRGKMIEPPVVERQAAVPDIPGVRFRAYAGPADLPGIVEVGRAANLADAFDYIPTVEQTANEFDHPDGFDPAADVLIAEIDGRIVASSRVRYARRDDEDTYDLTGDVHPDVRRRGIGRTLLHAGEARGRRRAGAVRGAPASTGDEPAWLSSWGPETAVGHGALMRAEGYVPIRSFFEMVKRDLTTPPAIPLPPGLELRPVTRASLRRVFDAEAEAFRDHWGRRDWGDNIFAMVAASPDLDLSLWRVAWDGDEVAGVVATAVFAEENATLGLSRGWLERISVRRPWRRRGVASSLILSACAGLHERGILEAALGVDAENQTGALRVYEGLGFAQHQREISWRKRLEPAGQGNSAR